jgi:hypothetical protein
MEYLLLLYAIPHSLGLFLANQTTGLWASKAQLYVCQGNKGMIFSPLYSFVFFHCKACSIGVEMG